MYKISMKHIDVLLVGSWKKHLKSVWKHRYQI